MPVVEKHARISPSELEQRMLAVDNAIAQQELEGLTVSQATIQDMRRAARGEITDDEVIANIYARFGKTLDQSVSPSE